MLLINHKLPPFVQHCYRHFLQRKRGREKRERRVEKVALCDSLCKVKVHLAFIKVSIMNLHHIKEIKNKTRNLYCIYSRGCFCSNLQILK